LGIARTLFIALAVAGSFGASCQTSRVTVPPSAQGDQSPIINITNYVTTGLIGWWVVFLRDGASTTAHVVNATRVVLTASATNLSGGVSAFTLNASYANNLGGSLAFHVATSATRDPSGQAPVQLAISGFGPGGEPGSNLIAVTLAWGESVRVSPTATNFNGQTTTLEELITAPAAPPPVPKKPTVSLTVDTTRDALGQYHVDIGAPYAVHWSVNGDPPLEVAVRGDQLSQATVLLEHQPATGSITQVSAHDTVYTVTAKNAGGTASAKADVFVRPNPAMRSCQTFYFRMTTQSVVTPCFYQSYCSADAATAKAFAEKQFVGYTATQVDSHTFNNVSCAAP
jgi:hypothetical protein